MKNHQYEYLKVIIYLLILKPIFLKLIYYQYISIDKFGWLLFKKSMKWTSKMHVAQWRCVFTGENYSRCLLWQFERLTRVRITYVRDCFEYYEKNCLMFFAQGMCVWSSHAAVLTCICICHIIYLKHQRNTNRLWDVPFTVYYVHFSLKLHRLLALFIGYNTAFSLNNAGGS